MYLAGPSVLVLCLAAAQEKGNRQQVDLPSMRQSANATDTMSQMVLSGQSSASAQASDATATAQAKAVAGGRGAGVARPARITCSSMGVRRGSAERMVISGDLGSQVQQFVDIRTLDIEELDLKTLDLRSISLYRHCSWGHITAACLQWYFLSTRR